MQILLLKSYYKCNRIINHDLTANLLKKYLFPLFNVHREKSEQRRTKRILFLMIIIGEINSELFPSPGEGVIIFGESFNSLLMGFGWLLEFWKIVEHLWIASFSLSANNISTADPADSNFGRQKNIALSFIIPLCCQHCSQIFLQHLKDCFECRRMQDRSYSVQKYKYKYKYKCRRMRGRSYSVHAAREERRTASGILGGDDGEAEVR